MWVWDKPPRKIDVAFAYPTYDECSMTKADQLEQAAYEKKVNWLRLPGFLFDRPCLSDITLREIQTCEILRRSPHPNICYYRGAVVEDGMIFGLMFDRYDMTLEEFLSEYGPGLINIQKCLQDIENGIEHIHPQGLVHCDIKSANVFVHLASGRFLIGDFDSVHREGATLRLKCGTNGWVPKGEDTNDIARYDIDWCSLAMIRAWLEKKLAFGQEGGDSRDERYWTTNVLAEAREQMLGETRTSAASVPTTQDSDGDDMMNTSW